MEASENHQPPSNESRNLQNPYPYNEAIYPMFGDTTLFEHAIIFNELDKIKSILNAGIDVNAKFSSGNTPLQLAIQFIRYEAAGLLIHAGADVRVIDASISQNVLTFLIINWQMYHFSQYSLQTLITHCMEISKTGAQTIAQLLIDAGCPIKFVLSIKSAQVIQEFLQLSPASTQPAMRCAVEEQDFENIQLILQYGNDSGKRIFYSAIQLLFWSKKLELWKLFVQLLPDYWHYFNTDAFECFDYMFKTLSTEHLQVLLDTKIASNLMKKFGLDLRVSIFRNEEVDAVELLEKDDFDVNAPGADRSRTALHVSVEARNPLKYIKFLVDSGADVNVKDNRGKTPLFYCIDRDLEDCIEVLLQHGADVQVVDGNGITVFHLIEFNSFPLQLLILAQLAISAVKGLPIKESIRRHIHFNKMFIKFYQLLCRQLENLKMCKISKDVSLFTVLTGNIESLYRIVINRDIMFLLDQYRERYGLDRLYYLTLKNKVTKTLNLYQCQCEIADIISNKIKMTIGSDNLVVKQISQYLSDKDVELFLKSRDIEGNRLKVIHPKKVLRRSKRLREKCRKRIKI